jgi:hypothetical protein
MDQGTRKTLRKHWHKRSLERDARSLKSLDRQIGDLPLTRVHQDSLRPHIEKRLADGISAGTLNRDVAVVRRILILAARAWRFSR